MEPLIIVPNPVSWQPLAQAIQPLLGEHPLYFRVQDGTHNLALVGWPETSPIQRAGVAVFNAGPKILLFLAPTTGNRIDEVWVGHGGPWVGALIAALQAQQQGVRAWTGNPEVPGTMRLTNLLGPSLVAGGPAMPEDAAAVPSAPLPVHKTLQDVADESTAAFRQRLSWHGITYKD